MRLRAAIALFALAVPALAQHGGGRAGSIGGHGFSGHAGFSGGAGFSRSSSFSRPTQRAFGYGAAGYAGYRGYRPSNYASRGNAAYGNRFLAPGAAYGAARANASGRGDRRGDGNRGRFDARRRDFNNWYTNYYPWWPGYGYPYVIDPGFYDWSVPDDSTDDQTALSPDYGAPYPDESYGPPDDGPEPGYAGGLPPWVPPSGGSGAAETASAAAPVPDEPLTVIFKDGRAPVKMQNYMMTAKVLTDLDSRHYAQFPIDQVDVAATQRANLASGIEFRIPRASPD